jgi:hypothetical protein
MGVFQSPSFTEELSYRTLWNYYAMMSVNDEIDSTQRSEYREKKCALSIELEEKGFCISHFYEVTQLMKSIDIITEKD